MVEISVRDNELFSFTRQKKIDHATNITGEIAACYKMNRLVLVNLDILDEYLETFHIEDEEFYK